MYIKGLELYLEKSQKSLKNVLTEGKHVRIIVRVAKRDRENETRKERRRKRSLKT